MYANSSQMRRSLMSGDDAPVAEQASPEPAVMKAEGVLSEERLSPEPDARADGGEADVVEAENGAAEAADRSVSPQPRSR